MQESNVMPISRTLPVFVPDDGTDFFQVPISKVCPEATAPPDGLTSQRLRREWKTMAAMIRCYCHAQHATRDSLCPECQDLLDYAGVRLERCRYGDEKPNCAKCPIHCYQRQRREQVKAVMRFAGPRMLWQHPVLALRHWLDSFRKAPVG